MKLKIKIDNLTLKNINKTTLNKIIIELPIKTKTSPNTQTTNPNNQPTPKNNTKNTPNKINQQEFPELIIINTLTISTNTINILHKQTPKLTFNNEFQTKNTLKKIFQIPKLT